MSNKAFRITSRPPGWVPEVFVERLFVDRSIDNSGHPYSEDAKLQERYQRVDHDTISITMTLTDPTAYTKPWVTGTMSLTRTPKEVMREDLCAPSDEKKYLEEVREPAARKVN